MADVPNKENYTIRVQIEWAIPWKKYLSRRTVTNHTSNQHVNSDGCVRWDEGFDHECKLKLKDSKNFSSQMIYLEVHGLGLGSDSRASVLGKFRMDVAKFAGQTEASEKIIKHPVRCCIGGSTLVTRLTVKLNSYEFQPIHNNCFVHPVSPTQLLPSLSSCIRHQNPTRKDTNNSTSESDEEVEPSYRRLVATNLAHGSLVDDKLEYCKDEDREKNLQHQAMHKSSLISHLSWKNLSGFRVPDHPRDTPILDKVHGEDHGDNIDNDHHCHLSPSQPRQRKVQRDFRHFGSVGRDRFEIGNWEKRKLVSRDGNLELVTEIFLASIDQRSQKASGGGACTVLATVIADWLLQNPEVLPL